MHQEKSMRSSKNSCTDVVCDMQKIGRDEKYRTIQKPVRLPQMRKDAPVCMPRQDHAVRAWASSENRLWEPFSE